MVWRIVAIGVSLISVPLTIRYLGSERYGAWVTITTVLTFLNITDLGLGASLTNALGKTQAAGALETGRRYVSSTVLTLCLIAVLIIANASLFAPKIAAFLFPHLHSPEARAEIAPAVWLALSIFALNLPLLVVGRVLAAHQKNAVANLWNMVGSVGNLGVLLVVIWFRGGLYWLVAGSFGFGLLVNITSAIWLFGFHKPWLRPKLSAIDPAFMKVLFADGWKFFIINVGWMINWQTDNLVISHFLGASQVTPYAVAFALFSLTSGLQNLAYPALWPAYTEAYAQRDYDWIRKTIRSNFRFSLVTSLTITAVLLIFAQAIIRLWAGAVAVPPWPVILWMAVWRLMFSTLLVWSCLLNATGHLKGMTIYGTITAVLNLVLSVVLVRVYGLAGVIAATAIAYAVASYIPTLLEARSVLRKFPSASDPSPA